jgi:hypothetical protein
MKDSWTVVAIMRIVEANPLGLDMSPTKIILLLFVLMTQTTL